ALVRGRIEALALKDVPEVAAAFRAVHLRADHPAGEVLPGGDVLRLRRIVEGGPAAMAVEFLLGSEKLRAAARAVISARALLVELFVNLPVGALRSRLPEDAVLLRGQDLFPLRVGFFDLAGGLFGGGGGGFHGGLL